jgi:glutamyl-tRNA reductase
MQHQVLIVGMNHRTASLELRERVAIADERLDDMNRHFCALSGVDEAAVVSTCNRVEVVTCSRGSNETQDRILEVLRAEEPSLRGEIEASTYSYLGRDAVRHLFRVASSLDSMVVGEPQILGQLKEFYARAASVGATGTVLHRCFHKAFSVAKRVRTETGVAARAVSVSSAAVELATQIFDNLEDKTAMLIGAGKMSELAARQLVANGVGSVMVTNRTFDRAVELAREFAATPIPFEGFARYLPMADIVIGSTAANGYVLTEELIHSSLRERKGRPIFCIDMSVPRNFDPRLNDIDNVYLYDIDDLADVAKDNQGEREREAAKGEEIVVAEVEAFWRWLTQLEVKPTIIALREKVERIRRSELERTLSAMPDLSPRQRAALEAMTAAIVNKVLHTPITQLKQHDRRTETFYIDAARRLFDLEDEES